MHLPTFNSACSRPLYNVHHLVAGSDVRLQLCRPDLIDPALLRPGRLDVLLYVGVAEDSHSKLKVLQALTRKFVMEDDIDLGIIAEKCPPTFTGADMYALSSDAWMTALKRTVAQVRLSLWFVALTASSGMRIHAAEFGMFCFCT